MSRIVVCLRVLNDKVHLARFLWGYDWVDKILVADGGSTDGTPEFLASHPKVEIRYFTKRVRRKDSDVWRNPEGEHINFMLDWAAEEGADWTILDDADSTPNKLLRHEGRRIIESSGVDTVWAFRMYIWGTDKWFPDLTGASLDPEDKWACLWAHRTGKVRWSEEDPFKSEFADPQPTTMSRIIARFPYAMLHYFCLTPRIAEQKRQFYNKTL